MFSQVSVSHFVHSRVVPDPLGTTPHGKEHETRQELASCPRP